jgi:hypothetical protein
MSKKSFTGGLKTVLGETPSRTKPAQQEQAPGQESADIRATFMIDKDVLEKVRAIAYWDRILIKDVLDSALRQAIQQYEDKNGPVKPKP